MTTRDPVAIGRKVSVYADLTAVTIRWVERIVGVHEAALGPPPSITDPTHTQTVAVMRRRAGRVTGPGSSDDDVQASSLGDYDRLRGLDEVVA